jgi:hypothetical protein
LLNDLESALQLNRIASFLTAVGRQFFACFPCNCDFEPGVQIDITF